MLTRLLYTPPSSSIVARMFLCPACASLACSSAPIFSFEFFNVTAAIFAAGILCLRRQFDIQNWCHTKYGILPFVATSFIVDCPCFMLFRLHTIARWWCGCSASLIMQSLLHTYNLGGGSSNPVPT